MSAILTVPELDMVPNADDGAYGTAAKIAQKYDVDIAVLHEHGPAGGAAAVVRVSGGHSAVLHALRTEWAIDDEDLREFYGIVV